jgi:pyrroline-5-carboxylate reductase
MKYGFIGCGNMGSAIAKAMAAKGADLAVTDRSGKAKLLGFPYISAEEIAGNAERIFLGVKPHMMQGVLEKLGPVLQKKKPLLITMAAGLTMDKIDAMAGGGFPVIRIMPNTPTAIGKGVIQYCANGLVTEEVLADWLADMAPCGLLDALDENLIDAASALSGSGPAYMYVFLEALADGAVACGIPRSKAYEYAAMTMVGSAEMYLQTKQHPGALKDAVCSPGGSTIQGLKALEEGAFRGTVMNCVAATCNRNKELGK